MQPEPTPTPTPLPEKPDPEKTEKPEAPEKKSAPEKPEVTLKCLRRAQNKNIVLATRPPGPGEKGPQTVRVRVRDNTHFILGMEIPARHIADDYYECTRLPPRALGRW